MNSASDIEVPSLQLYTYFRSSAAYRVRIALNLKGLTFESIPVHLVNDGGAQHSAAFRQINPNELVPAFIDPHQAPGVVLTQSLAILEYLEETQPTPPLLPAGATERAWVRSIAQTIACDIHPINNLRVLQYLTGTLHCDEAQKNQWYRHWCERGLAALELMLTRAGRSGQFCFADTPGLADCCLVPQVMNAQRFDCDLSAIPTILRINDACLALPAFAQAAPARQPDAPVAG